MLSKVILCPGRSSGLRQGHIQTRGDEVKVDSTRKKHCERGANLASQSDRLSTDTTRAYGAT